MMQLLVKKLHPDAVVPKYQREGDAALDLSSLEEVTISPGELVRIKTGLAMALPKSHVGIIKDRSGFGARALHVLGGVFDENYRGEWLILMINLGKETAVIKKGERCCQVVISPIPKLVVEEVNELDETNRGEGRFGSSGTH